MASAARLTVSSECFLSDFVASAGSRAVDPLVFSESLFALSGAVMNQIVDATVRTDQTAQWNFQISEVVIVCTFLDSWLKTPASDVPLKKN